MDSPGFSAQYCQYSVMDTASTYVLDTQLVDKRETGGASQTMESFGLLRCLVFLTSKNINIDACVTDQHPSIVKFFRKYD